MTHLEADLLSLVAHQQPDNLLASINVGRAREGPIRHLDLRSNSKQLLRELGQLAIKSGLFAHLSKFDHVPMHVRGHSRMMASESEPLTPEEFASLLTVGNTCAVREPPAVIPAEHSARLIELGYIVDLAGRLRMTSPGRSRIAAGFGNRPLPIEIGPLGVETGQHPTRRRNEPHA
jgi:hypothetical protein